MSETASSRDAECVRNEEYKIWKKQSPFLYDVCVSKALLSPTASVEWLPNRQKTSSAASTVFSTSELLFTSSEIFGAQNMAYTAEIDLPNLGATAEEIASSKPHKNELKVLAKAKTYEISGGSYAFCARMSPKVDLVAVACRQGLVKLLGAANKDLKAHENDALEVAWQKTGSLFASCSVDGTSALWTEEGELRSRFGGPGPAINAVQFAKLDLNELATAGDDRSLKFWDVRTKMEKPVREISDAHALGITVVDYSPFTQTLVATGSADGNVSLWDVRMQSASLLGLNAEAGQINALQFSPHEESVLATGGTDSQVKVWDLSRNGLNQSQQDEEEGPPELMFVHGGHIAPICDLAWHPTQNWTLCSASEDALVDVWRISGAIVNEYPQP